LEVFSMSPTATTYSRATGAFKMFTGDPLSTMYDRAAEVLKPLAADLKPHTNKTAPDPEF